MPQLTACSQKLYIYVYPTTSRISLLLYTRGRVLIRYPTSAVGYN